MPCRVPSPRRRFLQGCPLAARDLQVTGPCLSAQEWTDYRLAWNSSRYEGVNILRIPAKRVWLPDIVLYNKLSGRAGQGGEGQASSPALHPDFQAVRLQEELEMSRASTLSYRWGIGGQRWGGPCDSLRHSWDPGHHPDPKSSALSVLHTVLFLSKLAF